MDVELRIGGISVDRCSQSATVGLGVNAVTNSSIRKRNNGLYYIGDGVAVTPIDSICNLDSDLVDSVNVQMDNIALGPF